MVTLIRHSRHATLASGGPWVPAVDNRRAAPRQSASVHAARSGGHNVAPILLGVFFVTTLVAPAAPLNKIAFILMGGSLLLDMLPNRKRMVQLTAPPFLILWIFVYGWILSLLTTSDTELGTQFLLSVFILFLIYYIKHHDIDVDRLVEVSSVILLAFTALYWSSALWPDLPFTTPLVQLFEMFSLSSVTERDFLDAPTFSLQLGTTPFLYVAFCIVSVRLINSFRFRDALLVSAIVAAILLSASRGLITISVLFLLLALIGRTSLVTGFLTVVCAAVVLYAFSVLYLSNTLILSTEEASNAVKIGHVRSFFDQLTTASVIFGRGLASYYYSSGSDAFKSHTEITPLDMVRYFGIVLTSVLYFNIMFPVRRIKHYRGQNGIYVVAFVLYLALSMTNPVMFNSYGMLVILWYWSKVTYRDGRAPNSLRRF